MRHLPLDDCRVIDTSALSRGLDVDKHSMDLANSRLAVWAAAARMAGESQIGPAWSYACAAVLTRAASAERHL